MKRHGRLAAAIMLSAVATTLTACGGQNISVPQQGQQSREQTSVPAAQSGLAGSTAPGGIIGELDNTVVKSKVTSADSEAKMLLDEARVYIAGNGILGGGTWESGTLKVTVKNGVWQIAGYDYARYTSDLTEETLLEHFQNVFSAESFYAEIHIDENGKAFAASFTDAFSPTLSDIPPREAFGEGSWTWNGKTSGVSPSGIIVGTCPQVGLK